MKVKKIKGKLILLSKSVACDGKNGDLSKCKKQVDS